MTPRHDKEQSYIKQGFKNTPVNKSGLQTTVLYKGNIVVRIGDDKDYEHFVELIRKNIINQKNAPKITKHEKIDIGFGNSFFCTEMDLLEELSDDEAQRYQTWIDQEFANLSSGLPVSRDPFNLEKSTRVLAKYAVDHNLGQDFQQAKNIMKRGDTYVHIDPFQ